MKSVAKFLIVVSSCAVLTAATSITVAKGNIFGKQAIAQTPTNHLSPPTNSLNLNDSQLLYNENPAPTLGTNRGRSINRFITKDKAIGVIPKKAKLISAKLAPWSKYQTENFSGAILHDVSTERMVWVVKLFFPEGIDTEGGFFGEATLTTAYDAETGNIISQDVSSPPGKDIPRILEVVK
ncbi:hypothetical protein [Synechocystis sp. PCC 7509]|uniref:hypothetical protein n=1 Tax=Synechocystis sp. PCC 7509 TaxID=927677 RepID=UPI0002ACE21A|nr:hypothetical protein [Synechocystis sp. PCC 7509]